MEVKSLEFTIPCAECPDCGREIDLEDEDCRVIVIVICPRCNVSFQYEEEPQYH